MSQKSSLTSKSFKERALDAVRRIRPGSTLTYAEVARRAGNAKAARAVGTFMRLNQDPTVPCHRVVPTGGGFGNFNRGGIKIKEAILKAERKGSKGAHLAAFPKGKPLSAAFFDRPTLMVAHDLLGMFLVHRIGNKTIAAMITETEAYDGFDDKASHASRGQTKRNAPMFGPAGHWYAYFTYGMHWMLNAVTGPRDFPAAVLIRGAFPWDGPAKLTKTMRIGRAQDGKTISRTSGLWIEDRSARIPDTMVKRTARIGVDYAGAWAKKPYRFVIKKLP